MRTLALLALVIAALACGADAPPSCGAPGLVRACACVGGATGAQECGPGGAWDVCACPDGAVMDVGADARRDAARDAGVDAIPTPVDADPGCDGGAPNRCSGRCVDLRHDPSNCGTCGRACSGSLTDCVFGICQIPLDPDGGTADAGRCGGLAECDTPGFGLGCWNLATSNGRVPAIHCGACGNTCPAATPECVGGQCAPVRDGG